MKNKISALIIFLVSMNTFSLEPSKASQLVFLKGDFGPFSQSTKGDCGDSLAFKLKDVRTGKPFDIPNGQALIITSMNWFLGNTAASTGDYVCAFLMVPSYALNPIISCDKGASRVYSGSQIVSPGIRIPSDDVTSNPETICVHFFGDISASADAEVNLYGYLSKDR